MSIWVKIGIYLVVGIIATIIGLVWWQTGIMVLSVLIAEEIIRRYE